MSFKAITRVKQLIEVFPDLERAVPTPCGCPHNDRQMRYVIPHLNDIHRWSRERIADWVDTLLYTEEEDKTHDREL